MMMRILLLVAAAFCALGAPVEGADWPQWRGPNRDDVSKETGLLKSWPSGGPRLLWTFKEAGVGYTAPAIVGKHLYAMGGDNGKDFVYALDISGKTPKKVWATEIASLAKKDHGNGPRGSPTVDGGALYALGADGDLICVDTPSGKRRWQVNLARNLGGTMMSNWGYSESPLVDGDKVVVTPGGPQGTLAALDKRTGKVLWRSSEVTDPAGYSSIMVATVGGIRHYVQMTGKSVVGVGADDGRMLWRYLHESRVAAIPSPIIHENDVYVTSAYGAGCALLHLSPEGNNGVKVEEVYANKNMENQHGGVVLVGDYVYGAWGGNGPRRIQKWTCQELRTGKVVWQEADKLEKGSLTCADGSLYLYGEDSGVVVLIEASPEGWQEKGRFTLPKQSKIPHGGVKNWTHPVVANGKLYVRDQEVIFCYDVKDRAAAAQ
jgi:outer membrane protein assembly factor BamB